MKLLKFALLALTLHLFSSALSAAPGRHKDASVPTPSVALAMEPASWIFVAFGLLGGGFLHRRRLPGLNLTRTADPHTAPQPTATVSESLEAIAEASAVLRTSPRPKRRSKFTVSPAIIAPRTIWAGTAAALLLLLAARPASADPITFTAQAVSTIALDPSSDSFSLNTETGTVNQMGTAFVFQTGDFVIGDSEIPDQVIPFHFQDTVTLNGITQTFTLYGQDVVTQTADTLTIFAGTPLTFGDETFSVQSFTLSESAMGDFPVELKANVTPEPSSLLLLGTGIIGGALFVYKRSPMDRA